jgi:hypothetical protein
LEVMMGLSLRSVLAGGAAVLAVAAMAPAMAEDSQVHVLTVQLPGGGVERIGYTGDVAPRVVLVPAQSTMAMPMFAGDPFAALERISAMMQQQETAVLRQVQALSAGQGAGMFGLPPGASGYSFVSTLTGNGVCTRSVRITYNGDNTAPKMVSSTSGNCAPGPDTRAPADVRIPAPAIRPAPHTIEVRATGQSPNDGMARQFALNR